MAAVEMQLSGEPFATAMGRELTAYSRDWLPPNIYFDPSPDVVRAAHRPARVLERDRVVRVLQAADEQPRVRVGRRGLARLRSRAQSVRRDRGRRLRALAGSASSTSAARATPRRASSTPTDTPTNPLGWPGIWPTMEPFESFDPAIAPTNSISESCSITSDDDPGATGVAHQRRLRVRRDDAAPAGPREPGRRAPSRRAAAGGPAWKSALWIMNYLQIMHDSDENGHHRGARGRTCPASASPAISVLGTDQRDAVIGTYLGSSDIEGFQAGMMLTGARQRGAGLADGADDDRRHDPRRIPRTSSGSRLRRERPAPLVPGARSPSPRAPTPAATSRGRPDTPSAPAAATCSISRASSARTPASTRSPTRPTRPSAARSPAARYFDGDPFPADDQLADGEPTLHDRSLAMIRVALVNLARMHVDPGVGHPGRRRDGVSGGVPTRGTTLSATDRRLRAARAADDAPHALRPAGALPQHEAGHGDRRRPPSTRPPSALARADGYRDRRAEHAGRRALDLFYDDLTDATGRAWPGWDVSQGAPTSDDDSLDAHTAAVRAPPPRVPVDRRHEVSATARSPCTSASSRRSGTRSARLYRPVAGDTSSTVTYTPVRFGLVQAMLRDVYELIASVGRSGRARRAGARPRRRA